LDCGGRVYYCVLQNVERALCNFLADYDGFEFLLKLLLLVEVELLQVLKGHHILAVVFLQPLQLLNQRSKIVLARVWSSRLVEALLLALLAWLGSF